METVKTEKRAKLKFSDLEPNFKRLRIFNFCYAAAILLFNLAWIIYVLIIGDPLNRMLSCILMMLVAVLPFLIEGVFRFRFSNFVLMFIFTYAVVAGVLGSVVFLYHFLPGFDKAVHVLFGYTGCIAGLYILCKSGDFSKTKLITVLLFCFGMAAAIGCVWEISEFVADLLLGQEAQGAMVNGVVPITDTMWDIVANTGGAIIFMIHYVIHKKTNKNLLMGSIIKDFNS